MAYSNAPQLDEEQQTQLDEAKARILAGMEANQTLRISVLITVGELKESKNGKPYRKLDFQAFHPDAEDGSSTATFFYYMLWESDATKVGEKLAQIYPPVEEKRDRARIIIEFPREDLIGEFYNGRLIWKLRNKPQISPPDLFTMIKNQIDQEEAQAMAGGQDEYGVTNIDEGHPF